MRRLVLLGVVPFLVAFRIDLHTDSQTGSDPTCPAGYGSIAYREDTDKWRKCENGVWSNLDTTGSGEINDLEAITTGIADAEILVGTGANTAAYIAGLAACASDAKIEYTPGAPDTFSCEAIAIQEADITDLQDYEEEAHCADHDSADVDCSGDTILIAAGAVSADELDEAGVEAGLEAVIDVLDLADGASDSCGGLEVVRRNASDTAFECATVGGGDGLGPDGDKGDVTVGGTGTTLTVDDGVTVNGWDLGASIATTPAGNDNDTSLATTAFVQGEIDDGDFLTDNCTLENDSTPIPDSCVGNGTDDTGGGAATTTIYAANGSDTPITTQTTDPGVTLASKTITVAAGDIITLEVEADVMNNSGATKTYTQRCRIASTTIVANSDSTTLGAGTTRGTYRFICTWYVRSTSSVRATADLSRTPTTAAGTTQTAAERRTWNTSSSNWTGSQTFALNLSTSATNATQDAIVNGWRLTHQANNP